MEVHTTCKKLVKPSTPTPPRLRKFELSSFDQLQPLLYVPILFHYRATGGGVESALGRVRRLEESLSQTLTTFYHLAGRYGEDGVMIDCNDQGVEFVEARVDGKLDRLLLDRGGGGADRSELLLALPVSLAVVAGSSLPLVAVQVNVFECGGLVVSAQINHIVGDMYSMCLFMNSWAAKCRSQVAGEVDVIDRLNFDQARLFPPKEDLGKVFESSFVSDGQLLSLGRENLTCKRYVFKDEGLSRLRAETATGTGSELRMEHRPSRVVLLTALLCRVLMRIDRAKSGLLSRRPMAVTHMLNLRGRTGLPVREDVFGNYYMEVATVPFAGDKEPAVHELVDWVGTVLRDVIAEFGELEGSKEVARMAEARVKQVYEMLRKGEVNVVMVSSWCRFPVYGVDYGWGRPSLVGTVRSMIDRVIFLVDAESGDGIEAWVTLEDDDMKDFEHDPDILTYAFRS